MIGKEMAIYLGTDHRGFKLAEELYSWLLGQNTPVTNIGAEKYDEADDYVDYAVDVARRVAQLTRDGVIARGIVLCGSGVGVDVAANKVKGVRCGLGLNPEQVKESREADDINVLALAADHTNQEKAKEMVKVFLETDFSGLARHKRRLEKIAEFENS